MTIFFLFFLTWQLVVDSNGSIKQLENDVKSKAKTPLLSKAEESNFEETSRYADVMKFIDSLQQRRDLVRVVNFGKSEEGRDLPVLILADPPVSRPLEARRSGKPVVLVMANIHAGEVEGKEAMQHLSRRLVVGDLQPLLRTMVVMVVPIYNADGNERIDLNHRTAQQGPTGGVGTRENARGLDLNRDYMKLESREARDLVTLFTQWDPHLTVDLHTSNGSYHGYHLTYSPMLNPNADSRLIDFERRKMLPSIGRALQRRHHFRSYYYGNYATRERLNRESENFELQRSGRAAQPAEPPETRVWRTFDHRPMFGNNYVGLRNRLTILSEAYSYLDFRRRVEVTEAFVEEILRYTSEHAAAITALIARVDLDLQRGKRRTQGVEFEIAPLEKEVPILVGEVRRVKNPRSGREMTVMIEEKVTPVRMPDYGLFRAVRSRELPAAYILPPDEKLHEIIANLRQHGVVMEELTTPLSISSEVFTVSSINRATRVFQGHREVKLRGEYKTEERTWPSGSILIRTRQSLASLIFYLLEPESDSGYVRWNFLDTVLVKGEKYPVARLAYDPGAVSRVLN